MTIAYQFPSPANWQDFERLLQDLFPHYQIYGRAGQPQDGIDLVDLHGNSVIQAKKRAISRTPITVEEIASWANKAQEFYKTHQFEELQIATTQPRDKALQYALLSHLSNHSLPFRVRILFWDDLEEVLNGMPELVRKYYLTELYDDNTIANYSIGSLDHYISHTLFGKHIQRQCKQWPPVDDVIKALPQRVLGCFQHLHNYQTLKNDLAPLFDWVRYVFNDCLALTMDINNDLHCGCFLPIEWRCVHLHRLREHDVVAVLETERLFVHFLRSIQELMFFIETSEYALKQRDWGCREKLFEIGDRCVQRAAELKACMVDNAESLAAYESLQANLRLRGFEPMQRLLPNPTTNACFGLYGYRYCGDNFTDEDVYIKSLPHMEAGFDSFVVLEQSQLKTYIRSNKDYFNRWPKHSSVTHL
ncbi:hypothetical protein NB550_20670 [Vibrio parahaemolyticus]|uniref:hypothetical protein n=1 Tax=Vibrio parahaemolyticus TaxID=670 RepID=UPI0004714A87|nr:hypothetical protein [Vibrio parahaemolyticus]EKH9212784.1 hypothetical protein [Vibrio parahaemolyticus]MBY4653449.1 hypothetical protein [Vibrio parahaemolyticus]MCR9766284.1 hypothetical protein [Vibrio parahaemolyticus]MCR9891732.1 hypothetical protein [Vibrio parahaemolyticus]MCR9919903.1 hypothetical protein [Vibrio parahaemolyticus]